MQKWLIFLCFWIGPASFLSAQSQIDSTRKVWRGFVGISQHAFSLANPVGASFHPGIDGGIALMLNDAPKVRWFQTFRTGIIYQRYVQTAIPIYTELGLRFISDFGLAFGPQIGVGYLYSIADSPTFQRTESGGYVSGGAGRSQAFVTLNLGASYGTGPIRYFVNYQLAIQGPYVAGRAPVLPYAGLRAGVSFPICR